MTLKLTLFFLVAVFSAQGIYARNLDPQNVENRGIFEDIFGLLLSVSQALIDIGNQLPPIMNNLNDRIESLSDDKNVLGSLKELIDGTLNELGIDAESIKECVDTANTEAESLDKDVTEKANACQDDALNQRDVIGREFDEMQKSAEEYVLFLQNTILKCLEDNSGNIIGVTLCYYKFLRDFKSNTEKFVDEMYQTFDTAKVLSEKIVNSIDECVATIDKQIVSNKEIIVNNLKTCASN